MASRFTICLLFASWMSVAGRADAQSVRYWAPQQASAYGPSAVSPGSSLYGDSYSGAMQASFNPEMVPGGEELPEPYVLPYAEPSYLESNPDNHEPLWQPNRPIEHFLTEAFEDSFIRIEYLQWDVSEPGDQLLGAHPAKFTGIDDPREFFPVFDGLGNAAGFAKVFDMSGFAINDTQGIRGTFGTHVFEETDFEANWWGLAQRTVSHGARFLPDSTFFSPDGNTIFIPPVPLFIGTTTYLNGQPSNNVFLWDQSFRVDYTTEFWGTEVKFLNEHGYWGPGTTFQSLLGFQYVQVHERLLQTGRAAGGHEGTIDSNVLNHLYGPTAGFRTEYETKWFTAGVEPKVAISLNSQKGSVTTNQLRSIDDPRVSRTQYETSFSPIMQLSVYAKVRLNSHINLFVSFDGSWLTRVGRAHTGIYYNDNGALNPADIRPDDSHESILLHGITAGGEVLLW